MGVRVVTLLTTTAALSFTLMVAARLQRRAQQPFYPVAQIGGWHSEADYIPISDDQRDSPRNATYKIYTNLSQPPIYLSVAPIATLNSLSPPWRYLLDPDGRLMDYKYIRPTGAKANRYIMEVAMGRGDRLLLIHWIQAPGTDAVPEVTDTPKGLAKALLLHRPVYVCDVWMPLRTDVNFKAAQPLLQQFAQVVDLQIQRGAGQ